MIFIFNLLFRVRFIWVQFLLVLILIFSGTEILTAQIKRSQSLNAISVSDVLFKKAIYKYQKIKRKGGWKRIPSGNDLAVKVLDERVGILRNRLILTDDFKKDSENYENAYYFNQRLKKAVIRFQKRHGLYANGTVNSKTRLALNISVKHRIRQLKLNKKRHSQVLQKLNSRYILVNIPGFYLKAVNRQKTVLKMRVVVGKHTHMTPSFSDRMSFLVINPYWYIPPNIVKKDIIPRLIKSEDVLFERGIKIFKNGSRDLLEIEPGSVNWKISENTRRKYYFRQEPGKDNSLGLIKFILMNSQKIYLHDTPHKELFSHVNRAKSSGCIRLSKPAKLAAFVLDDRKQWSARKIARMMQSGYQRKIFLPEPISVYLVYWTAWVESNGEVHFRPDIYHKD